MIILIVEDIHIFPKEFQILAESQVISTNQSPGSKSGSLDCCVFFPPYNVVWEQNRMAIFTFWLLKVWFLTQNLSVLVSLSSSGNVLDLLSYSKQRLSVSLSHNEPRRHLELDCIQLPAVSLVTYRPEKFPSLLYFPSQLVLKVGNQ